MIKKLREFLYNIKTKNKLKNMKFDDFAFYGNSEVPAFIAKKGKGKEPVVFIPKTDETLKIAFEKLSMRFFRKISYMNTKERLKFYINTLNLKEETLTYCMNIFKYRNNMLINENDGI